MQLAVAAAPMPCHIPRRARMGGGAGRQGLGAQCRPYGDVVQAAVERAQPPQLSQAQLLWVAALVRGAALAARRPVNFLVFGLGFDSDVWQAVNCDGRTAFLENLPVRGGAGRAGRLRRGGGQQVHAGGGAAVVATAHPDCCCRWPACLHALARTGSSSSSQTTPAWRQVAAEGWRALHAPGLAPYRPHSPPPPAPLLLPSLPPCPSLRSDLSPAPPMQAHRVAYRGRVEAPHAFFSAPWLMEVPQAVGGTCWDVVLVDAPQGYEAGQPGEQQQPAEQCALVACAWLAAAAWPPVPAQRPCSPPAGRCAAAGRMESTYYAMQAAKRCIASGQLVSCRPRRGAALHGMHVCSTPPHPNQPAALFHAPFPHCSSFRCCSVPPRLPLSPSLSGPAARHRRSRPLTPPLLLPALPLPRRMLCCCCTMPTAQWSSA